MVLQRKRKPGLMNKVFFANLTELIKMVMFSDDEMKMDDLSAQKKGRGIFVTN